MPTPTVPGWGFFMRAASRTVWDSPSSLPVGEEEERGQQAVVPPAALLPSILCIHLTRDVSHVYWGFSTACRRTSTRGSSRTGHPSRSWVYGPRDLPVRLSVGHTSPQCGVCRWCFPYAPLLCGCSVRRNVRPDRPPAAADQPATMWQCAHARQALRSISRQEGGEE